MKQIITLFLLTFTLVTNTQAKIEAVTFENKAQEKLYKSLISEVRCLVCQGQTIAGSNAGFAKKIRALIHEMVLKNHNRDEILNEIVASYGESILYNPPVKKTTYVLWLGPFIFLIISLLILLYMIKKKRMAHAATFTSQQKSKINKVLNSKE